MINGIHKTTTYLTIVTLFLLIAMPARVTSNEIKCNYDTANPSIASARSSLKALNYACAEQELTRLLKSDTTNLTLENRASAHILLGTVYYLMAQQLEKQRERILNEFVEAFRVYRMWSGSLEIELSELREILNEARDQVEREAQAKLDSQVTLIDSLAVDVKKPGKRKSWLLFAGGVVVAAVAIITFVGSKDSGGTDDSGGIPSYPPPPN